MIRSAWHALAAYTFIALAATWPLAAGLGRDIAWDLGDPVFVTWVLAWDCEQLLAILGGDFSRIRTFFDANIFHPAPLTLAYSEHFLAQAVQVLPIYAVGRNPILAYNLLFLSTFVLSGVGMYLFVRELTGNTRAAFVAGLLFAFAPYRWAQSSHLQVLSSQWMPFALYGFRRYFDTRRLRPLAGAAAALVIQNLSCMYYLMFFSPFVAAYVTWEMWQRRLWRDRGVIGRLALAAGSVLAITAPFLLPYVAVREAMELERSRSEVMRYSADVYSYATASIAQPLWGDVLRAFPKPEGDLFPGIIAVLLAVVGLVTRPVGQALSGLPGDRDNGRPTHRTWPVRLLLAAAVAHVLAAALTLVFRRMTFDLWLFELRISNVTQLLVRAAVLGAVVLVLSPPARLRARAFLATRGFFLGCLLAAMWLSLGPAPQALGRPLDLAAPFAFLHDNVPGFDGTRVPARFAMVAVLMLAVLGGFGAATISRWRWGTALLAALCVAALAEGAVVPFTVNGASPVRGFNAPEPRLYRPARAPAVYKEAAQLPSDAVIAELPLGTADFDLRALYYSTAHWRRIANGYSGFFPPHYGQLALAVSDVPRQQEAALNALRENGVTHVIVHEGAWLDDRGPATTAALIDSGAVELYRNEGDVLVQLPR